LPEAVSIAAASFSRKDCWAEAKFAVIKKALAAKTTAKIRLARDKIM
jgi:hypothetical protein